VELPPWGDFKGQGDKKMKREIVG